MIEISNLLIDYYSKKRDLIERSIDTIMPLNATISSMNHLVGQIDLSWDLNTLQKTFFNPVLEYLGKRNENIIALSTCLFLEAAGLELESFIPILAIPVFFETSNEIFKDITEWTTPGNAKPPSMSALDISIAGNVSIALLTLPSHNLISHRPDPDTAKSLKLYESLTTNIFNSLFANGIKLFWEQSKKIPGYNEYFEAASLLNKGFLRFGGDLWLIFNEKENDESVNSALKKFIDKRNIAIQMESDISDFKKKIRDLNCTNHFSWFSNFLFIDAVKKLNYSAIDYNEMSDENAIEIIEKADSLNYANKQINNIKGISDKELGLLPFQDNYKELLKSYCDYLGCR